MPIFKGSDSLKQIFMKVLSATLALSLIMTSLGACTATDTDKDNDKRNFAEMKSDSELAYNTKGEFSVNLTTDNITLNNDISADSVKVFYSYIDSDKLPDIDASQAEQ